MFASYLPMQERKSKVIHIRRLIIKSSIALSIDISSETIFASILAHYLSVEICSSPKMEKCSANQLCDALRKGTLWGALMLNIKIWRPIHWQKLTSVIENRRAWYSET
jgi:hypothetical protein